MKGASPDGTTILVTRVTGAHGRGIYTLASSVAMLASMITALGIGWAGIYYIGKRLFPLADVASTLLTVAMVSAGVAIGGVAAAYLLFQHSYFHEVSTTQVLLMLALAALFQVADELGDVRVHVVESRGDVGSRSAENMRTRASEQALHLVQPRLGQ